jgi:ferritin-like protein
MTDLRLETIDRDGALAEGLEGVTGQTRAGLLRSAVFGGGALLAAVSAPTAGAQSAKRDIAILNFALTLEYLQAAFYTETFRIGSLRGALLEQARVVGAHERAHVVALRNALGSRAVKRPRFNFAGATETPAAFRKTAVAFEDLGTAAYKGQAPNLRSRAFLAAALAIHTVEARHAAWIRRLAGIRPAARAFDEPVSEPKALQLVASTNFVVQTRGRGAPRFTG